MYNLQHGSGTLCGFHTYVGVDDRPMWVSCWEAAAQRARFVGISM